MDNLPKVEDVVEKHIFIFSTLKIPTMEMEIF